MSKEEVDVLLNSITLSKEELTIIEKLASISSDFRFINSNDKLSLYIKIYKLRFKLFCPVPDMARFFNLTRQSINWRLKRIGWEYTSKESGLKAAQKRNYKEIRAKTRGTFLNNNKVYFGSSLEEYVRQQFNIKLTQKLAEISDELDVIVGVNNISILTGGHEADIPIVIFKGNSFLKYVIEPGADYYHKDKVSEDLLKQKDLKKKGYKTFIFVLCDAVFSRIDRDIDFIVDQIIEDVLSSFHLNIIELATKKETKKHSRGEFKHLSSSIYKGLTTTNGKWAVKIMYNFRGIYLGAYTSEIEAAQVYNMASIYLFEDKAELNDVPEPSDDLVSKFKKLRTKLRKAKEDDKRLMKQYKKKNKDLL